MMIVASVIVGIGTCAFSSLPTIMTLYAGGKQGAALSAYNLAAGQPQRLANVDLAG